MSNIDNKYGVIFRYKDGSTSFSEVLKPIDDLKEKPIGFTLNFNQETLAAWIVECKSKLHKESNDK
jgi:predicted CopG family antitoxin